MNGKLNETVKRGLHVLVGLLLIWASLSKIGDVQSFLGSLMAYDLGLPRPLLSTVTQTLPWLELFCGLMLLAGHRVGAALVCCLVMFGAFTLATGQAWARGLTIDCGCFNLGLLGLADNQTLRTWLASPLFAFARALVLLMVVALLLRPELRKQPAMRN